MPVTDTRLELSPSARRSLRAANENVRATLAARVARLPAPTRRLVYGASRRVPIPGRWTYHADGLATAHHSPFLDDRRFSRLYEEMAASWYKGQNMDARWRVWLLTRYGAYACRLRGNFAEFGTYRAGCAWMLLSTADLSGRAFHLFDTFTGIPDSSLTQKERRAGMGGVHGDTSVDYVRTLLAPWDPIPRLWAGDVFKTMPAADTGELAFVHLDLNAAAPTAHVLEHVYGRLVPGAVILFDDYGARAYGEQRRVIEAFLRDKPETLIALPTGQALFHRAP